MRENITFDNSRRSGMASQAKSLDDIALRSRQRITVTREIVGTSGCPKNRQDPLRKNCPYDFWKRGGRTRTPGGLSIISQSSSSGFIPSRNLGKNQRDPSQRYYPRVRGVYPLSPCIILLLSINGISRVARDVPRTFLIPSASVLSLLYSCHDLTIRPPGPSPCDVELLRGK